MEKTNFEVFSLQKAYFKTGITKDISFRLEQLKRLKKVVKENEKDIIESIYKDLGKCEFEVFATEIGQFYNEVNEFIRKLRKWTKPERMPVPITHFPCKGEVVKEPYGITLLISPFNYPFGLVFSPLVGAIASGNCAMIKPSEYTEHFVEVLTRIINENFEKEYIYVCDPFGGKETVEGLLALPFDYIFFTGSSRVGKIVMEKAAKHATPVTLELGGKCPCIITEDANIEMAAKRIVWGKLMNAGQTCVAPDYIWVQEAVKERLLAELKKQVILQYGENPKENKDFCRIINGREVERLKGYLEGATIFHGGEYDVEGHYFAPTILTDITWNSPVMKDEIFGPILPVMSFSELDLILEHLVERPKPLALYVFTEKKDISRRVVNRVSSGDVMINDVVMHVATTNFPFGGVGNSGMGSYHGKYSLETFTHTRTIMERKTWMEFFIRFAPYKNHISIFRKLMR